MYGVPANLSANKLFSPSCAIDPPLSAAHHWSQRYTLPYLVNRDEDRPQSLGDSVSQLAESHTVGIT